MYRNTYVLIDEDILEQNVKTIKEAYNDYQYYIGVVKNDAYHHGLDAVGALIKGGINYLAVSSLDEAVALRCKYPKIPILCLEPISLDFLEEIIKYNVTITVESLEYAKKLCELPKKEKIKVHLALDTGMHRLGFGDPESLKEAYSLINETNHLFIEGLYSHFATSGVMDNYYDYQVKQFLEITKDLYLEAIPIVHMGRSLSLVQHEKLNFCNGIRLGIIMFGFNGSLDKGLSLKSQVNAWKRKYLQKKFNISPTITKNSLDLKTAFTLYTSIISRREVKAGDYVGYQFAYKVLKKGYIYTLAIGYADGVDASFRYVLINKKKCLIVADCMDMLMVYSESFYDVDTPVEIFGEQRSVKNVSQTLKMNAYHVFNQISHRVPRVSKKSEVSL